MKQIPSFGLLECLNWKGEIEWTKEEFLRRKREPKKDDGVLKWKDELDWDGEFAWKKG